jgi:uncharacterized protein (TIGR03437 family)
MSLNKLALAISWVVCAWAHAPILPPITGPLTVQGSRLLDQGTPVTLRGMNVTADGLRQPRETFGILRVRWNLNAVRLPATLGPAAIQAALDSQLAVILAGSREADWRQWGAHPRVLLEVDAIDDIAAVRNAGARHPLVRRGPAVNDPQVIYGASLTVGDALLDPLRPQLGRAPVLASDWGTPAGCVSESTFLALLDFEVQGISWMAAAIPDYEPRGEESPCADLKQTVIQWTTGDPFGFGFLRADAIANAAGGPAAPLVPGALMTLFVEQLGPERPAVGRLDTTGQLPRELQGTRVLIDGVAAPLLYADAYQINLQVPYELRPGATASLQVIGSAVPSNRLTVPVAEASPELFQDFSTRHVVALNQDGSRNAPGAPAAPGSIVVLFGAGAGDVVGPRQTGTPAGPVHPVALLPSRVDLAGQATEVLFAGEVPGFIGLTQLNVRLPNRAVREPRAESLVWTVGTRPSRSPVTLWVR